ncbi:TPA: hypothetical protein DCZ39_05250 [Patescibacteria group bacterium]|nr:hypothetical protein [Candidatus Gracilibacteria bacterium]
MFHIFAMKLLQTNNFDHVSVPKSESLQLIDIFDVHGKKTIELSPHSSLTYLIVGSNIDIDIQLIST